MALLYRGQTAKQYLSAAKGYRTIDRPAALLAAAEAERLGGAGIDCAEFMMKLINGPMAQSPYGRQQTVDGESRRLDKEEWIEFLRGALYGCEPVRFGGSPAALDDTLAHYADIIAANPLAVGDAFFQHLPGGPDFHAEAAGLRQMANGYLELAVQAEADHARAVSKENEG